MPVHVIVWAKEFYKLLFNPKVEESMLFEDQNGDEKSTFMDIVLQLRDELAAANDIKIREKARQLLIALYNTEIQKQLDMDRFKTAKKVPSPIPIDSFTNKSADQDTIAPSKRSGYKHTDIWSQDDCIAETMSCIMEAAETLREGGNLLPEFDKDDDLAMRFVTCTSNLRSYVFGIEPIQSHYSAKGIAGNIIPAIATTNAIVAGLQVLQAFQVLAKQMENKPGELKECCRFIYCLRDKTRQGYYLQPTSLPSPNPKCFVCRSAVLQLTLDTTKWTFETLLRRIVKKELGFTEPSINIGSSMIYEEGDDIDDDEYAAIVTKTLIDLPAGGMKDGTIITIEDFTQDLEVDVCINHKSEWEKKEADDEVADEDRFIIGGDKPIVGKGEEAKDQPKNDEKENDDDIVILDDENSGDSAQSKKREMSDEDDIIEVVEGPATKKVRL
jgi:ubiquitin-like 1-activating enzyme E1 B